MDVCLTGVHLMVCISWRASHGVYLMCLMDVSLTGVHLMGVYLINVHLMGVHLMGVHLWRR
jgi:hypothetical protein